MVMVILIDKLHMTRMAQLLSTCTVLLLSLILISSSHARTWHIKADGMGDVATIQEGLDLASDGDTVLCGDGTYTSGGNRDLDFGGKRLLLRSESGPQATVLDCQGSPGQAHVGLFFHSGEDSASIVDGFTITNAYSYEHGAITVNESTPSIRNCIIIANDCHGIDCYPQILWTDKIRIEDCEISYNTGDGVRAWGARTSVTRSDISFNGLNGVSINWSGELEMSESLIRSNGEIGLFMFTMYEYFSISNCSFYDNRIGFFWDANYPKSPGAVDLATASDSSWVSNCIFAFNREDGVQAYLTASIQHILCSDSYGNGGNDWTGSIFGPGDGFNNFSADPLFCNPNPMYQDFTLATGSPCLPPNNTCGVLIGAYGEGCGTASAAQSTESTLLLSLNYPNPFNPTTTISFTLPEKVYAKLSIFDIEGKLVKTLVNDTTDEGFREVTWDGLNAKGNPVSSGVYFYSLKAGDKVLTRKMVLLK